MKILISPDELKLLVTAIAWTLWTPFYRSKPPEFTEIQKDRLQTICETICRELHVSDSEWSATLDDDALTIRGRTVAMGRTEIHCLRSCLDACFSEIGHSPAEILAVTGLPISLYIALLDRVSKLGNKPECSVPG